MENYRCEHLWYRSRSYATQTTVTRTLCMNAKKQVNSPAVLFAEYLFLRLQDIKIKGKFFTHWQLNRTHLPGAIRTEIRDIRVILRTIAWGRVSKYYYFFDTVMQLARESKHRASNLNYLFLSYLPHPLWFASRMYMQRKWLSKQLFAPCCTSRLDGNLAGLSLHQLCNVFMF